MPQDRLRKLTDENRELATTLRREAEAAFRQKSTKTTLKRKAGSDRGSARDSEERQTSVPGRVTKRARDNEIEKVSKASPQCRLLGRGCYVLERLQVSLLCPHDTHDMTTGRTFLYTAIREDCNAGQFEIPSRR